jgi:hypothetical protein
VPHTLNYVLSFFLSFFLSPSHPPSFRNRFWTDLAPIMLTLVSLVLALVFLQPPAVCAVTGQQIARDLRSELSSGCEIVLTSDDSAYAAGNFTPRYDVAAPPTYTVAVKPMLAADVQKVVGFGWSLIFHASMLLPLLGVLLIDAF